MKKYLTLSLLIVSTTFTHVMEKESSFSCSQISNESELINNLRKEKNNLEKQLSDDTWAQDKVDYNSIIKLSKFWSDEFNPINFFRSCYYKFHHKMTIYKFKLSYSLLDTYQNVQIDGYSALGAAILANEISTDEKRNFIQELINLDFKPTVKDIRLAELYVYDSYEIAEYKNIFLHLLQDNPNSNWFMLPHDIREQIVRLLIQFFKKDAWLLSEKSEQKEDDKIYCIRAGIVEII